MDKLAIELIPRSSWGSNLRKELSPSQWDSVRRKCYQKAGHTCEICGGKGDNHPVECHEIWEFDRDSFYQNLIGIQALCPLCHVSKHLGTRFSTLAIREHMMTVNGWDYKTFMRRKREAEALNEKYGNYKWVLNISILETL